MFSKTCRREDPATEEQEGRDASEDTQPIAQPPIDQQAEQSKPTPPPQSAAAAPAPAPVSAPAAAPAPFALKSPQTIIVPTTSIHQPAQALPQHPIVGMNPAMSAAPAMLPGHQMMPPRGQVNPMALHQMQMLQQYQQMQQIHQLHQMQALQGHSPSALQHALLHHQQLQQQQQQQQGMPVLQQVGPGGHAVRPAFYPGTLPHQGQAHPPGSAPGN